MEVHRLRQIFRILGQSERARGRIVPCNSMQLFTAVISEWLCLPGVRRHPAPQRRVQVYYATSANRQKGAAVDCRCPGISSVLLNRPDGSPFRLLQEAGGRRQEAGGRRQGQLSRFASGISSEASTPRTGRRDCAQRCGSAEIRRSRAGWPIQPAEQQYFPAQ
jgi:hypothetical protein